MVGLELRESCHDRGIAALALLPDDGAAANGSGGGMHFKSLLTELESMIERILICAPPPPMKP